MEDATAQIYPRFSSALASKIVQAYRWQRSIGNTVVRHPLGLFLVDVERPEVWMANHLGDVTAEQPQEIDDVLAAMAVHYAHCSHRMVSVSPFTPPPFIARLAHDDYRELTPTIQMVLTGDLAPIEAPALRFRAARSEQDWEEIYSLMRLDHTEGARSHYVPVSEEVTRGLVIEMRKKTGPATTRIVDEDGVPCAYGASIECIGGVGMVEDLFTLPSHRRRGIASALIRHCVQHLQRHGREVVFLGAHASEKAKHLYRRLGFVPLLLTREFFKELD